MKAIMAISKDGFVCKDKDDDMSWTSKTDKKIFRLLTQVSLGGISTDPSGKNRLFCGYNTGQTMKDVKLNNRILKSVHTNSLFGHRIVFYTETLSEDGSFDIIDYRIDELKTGDNAWIIGGQKTIMQALNNNILEQVFICRSDVKIHKGVKDEITPTLMSLFNLSDTIKINDVSVEIWNRI